MKDERDCRSERHRALKVITQGQPPRSETYRGTVRLVLANVSKGVPETRLRPNKGW